MPPSMRSRVTWLVAAAALVPAAAWGGKFGGFSGDGARYLDGEAKVCAPLAADADGQVAGTPKCAIVTDKKELAGLAFRKPKASDATPDGRIIFAASRDGRKLRVDAIVGEGDPRALVAWDAPAEVAAVGELFLSPDSSLVALDYTTKTLRGVTPATVVFDVRKPLARPQAPMTRAGESAPPPARATPPPRADGGSAYDRAMKLGGVWEQVLIACEQARVTLTLKKTMKYTVRIETRCQGDKRVSSFQGKWVAEGAAGVVLRLENDDGREESIGCQLGADAGEPVLHCADPDIEFTMKPARR